MKLKAKHPPKQEPMKLKNMPLKNRRSKNTPKNNSVLILVCIFNGSIGIDFVLSQVFIHIQTNKECLNVIKPSSLWVSDACVV